MKFLFILYVKTFYFLFETKIFVLAETIDARCLHSCIRIFRQKIAMHLLVCKLKKRLSISLYAYVRINQKIKISKSKINKTYKYDRSILLYVSKTHK